MAVSAPGLVAVSVPALPPEPNPAPTPPVPAAPELVVMFFVVSPVPSECPVVVAFSEQLRSPIASAPMYKIFRISLIFY